MLLSFRLLSYSSGGFFWGRQETRRQYHGRMTKLQKLLLPTTNFTPKIVDSAQLLKTSSPISFFNLHFIQYTQPFITPKTWMGMTFKQI